MLVYVWRVYLKIDFPLIESKWHLYLFCIWIVHIDIEYKFRRFAVFPATIDLIYITVYCNKSLAYTRAQSFGAAATAKKTC